MNTVDFPVAEAYRTVKEGVSAASALAEKGQIETALHILRDLRIAFPDAADSYLKAGDILNRQGQLQQALALLRDGQARFSDDIRFNIDLGWLTLRMRNFQAAYVEWERVRETWSKHPVGYVGGAITLREMKRLDEANTLLESAIRLFPADAGPRVEHAWLAHRTRQWEEALHRWEAIRRIFPNHPSGFTGAAATLAEMGQPDEAETMLLDAVQNHPDDPAIAIELARITHRLRKWDTAISRWQVVRTNFANFPAGFTGGAETLREAGRWQDAEALLSTAAERWPNDLGIATEIAWLAYHRRDWETAIGRWAKVRDRFPNHQSGYLIGARALQAAGQASPALAVLAEAQRRWPDDQSVLITAADIANARGDYADCVRIGKQLVALFPDEGVGYFHASRALRELGRYAEAEDCLTDAPSKFPDDASILSIWASLSMGLQNWPEAIRRWRLLQQRFPAEPKFFWQCANALTSSGNEDEAEMVLQEATQRFPSDTLIASMYTESLLRRGAPVEADAAAARMRQGFPDDPSGYGLGIRARRAMGDDAGATELLQGMLARLPQDQMALRLWAEDAGDRRDWATAEERWTRFREQFPDDPAGYIGGALALREGGWPDGSDALLARGIELLPNNGRILLEYVHNATRRKDSNEAVSRWEKFRRHLPESPAGYLGGAQSLRDAGQLDDAEALLRRAVGLFPTALNLAAEFANIARIRRDAPAMVERFRLISERFPDRVAGAVGYAEGLSVAGRHEEAEAILLDAQNRFPNDIEPFAEYAQVAIRRGAWAISLERWQNAQRRFPRVEFLSHRIFEAQMRVAEVNPDAISSDSTAKAGTRDNPPDTLGGAAPVPDMKDVVKDFESLGGAGHGCEFGLFQRSYGVEPLGLLRWADLGAELLIAALEARFDGVGLPENTLVFTPSSNGRAEYWTRDKRYWMAMRCFIPADEVPYEKMVTQACRRIQFLRRKLIDDLESGEKIFVFKSLTRNLTDEELARLHRATRRYGNNTLLYVRYEDAENPNGSVRVAGPGLMIGYVDRFSFSREDKDLGSAVDRWAAVCGKAHAIWRSGGVPGTMPGGQAVSSEVLMPTLVTQSEAAQSRGQRLIAGRCLDQTSLTLQWSAEKVAEIKRTIAENASNTREHAFASILLDSVEGNRASARARIGQLVDDFPKMYPHEGHLFEGLLLSSIISGQWDITPRLLHDRFGVNWCAAVDVKELQPPGQIMRWEIDQAGKSRFYFSRNMFLRDRTWIELFGWARSMTLYHNYTVSSGAEHGSVLVSLGDSGVAPGLAPSEYRSGYFLVPDPVFLNTDGYAALRATFDAGWVPWNDRLPVAFWRGASTGQLRSDWRNLPRIKLCLIARQHAETGLIDAGITSFVGLQPAMLRNAEAEGLGAGFVKPADFMRYKYQIDIDGNTNAWAALFQKLLTGSPVLKIRSPLDYRQWFYDDLIPWSNYVPVEAEMGDLIDKIEWLRQHDDAARRIGEAGLTLATSMSHASELKRARATVSAAIRYFSGRPEVMVRFGDETVESCFLVDGWSGIVTMSGAAGRYALGPESRVKFPKPASAGDLELRLTLAAAGSEQINPFRMLTIVNGTQVNDTIVSSPCHLVCMVPAAVIALGTQTTVTLLFPDPGPSTQLALPAGLSASGLLFSELQLAVP